MIREARDDVLPDTDELAKTWQASEHAAKERILFALLGRRLLQGDLRRALEDHSEASFQEALRAVLEEGLVQRRVVGVNRIEYGITSFGVEVWNKWICLRRLHRNGITQHGELPGWQRVDYVAAVKSWQPSALEPRILYALLDEPHSFQTLCRLVGTRSNTLQEAAEALGSEGFVRRFLVPQSSAKYASWYAITGHGIQAWAQWYCSTRGAG